MAVEYCLENKTFSMTALADTYRHLLEEQNQEAANVQNILTGPFGAMKHEAPEVAARSVAEYETMVKSSQGGAR